VSVRGLQSEEYVELVCVEMPEVRFDDVIVLKAGNQGSSGHIVSKPIDDYYLQVCEPDTIKPISATASSPVKIGSYIKNNKIFVEIIGEDIKNKEIEIVVKLSGLRRGTYGRKFAKHTKEEMEKNSKFWDSWKK
jgi:hypothetical protein